MKPKKSKDYQTEEHCKWLSLLINLKKYMNQLVPPQYEA